MNYKSLKRVVLQITATCLLLLDLCLSWSGAPSVGGSNFVVWLVLPVGAGVIAYRAYLDVRRGGKWRDFIAYVLVAAGFLFVLNQSIAPYAENYARLKQKAVLDSFLRDPFNSELSVSDADRQLMLRLTEEGYAIKREKFQGPIKRLDYFVVGKRSGQRYDLVFEVSDNPQINVLPAR